MSGAREIHPEGALSELGRRMNEIGGIPDPSSRIREYNRLVGEYPNSSLAAFNLALDLWKSGQRSEAGAAARRAIGISPDLVDQLPSGLAASLRPATAPGDATTDRVGELVAGFRITDRISEDPRTELYAVERGPARGYLRVLRRSLSQNPAIVERFLESAKLLQRISHPGLATIVDAGMLADGCAYVLVQPEPGELLNERIWRNESLEPLAPSLGTLAEALAALHAQGVYYLGIQPERIQVAVGALPALQLLDSEHVRGAILQLPTPTLANGPVCEGVDPVLFMAPETFSGRAEVGPPADVYALGVLAYFVLCGRPPLQAASIGEVIAAHLNQAPVPVRSTAPGLPQALGHLVDAMLDKDPGRRPSMVTVAEAWTRIFSAPAAPAPPAVREIRAPAETPDLAVGSMLGDYRLIRKLGEGRTGVVFEAYHERLRRRDAIKLIHPELCRSEEEAVRFLREAQAANQVAHPGIVSILHQARAPGGQIYTVMELLDGESLRDRIERGAMPAEQVRRLCRHVALAMVAAHEHGVIHRDLKPENVIVVPDPDAVGGERIKVVDFGTANLTESTSRKGPYVEGTPAYMSPEQLRDTRTAGTKSDVFALGVMMQEMLAGRRLATPDVPEDCPRWVAELIRRMQDPVPSRRPSMQQVADLLSKQDHGPQSWVGVAAASAEVVSETAKATSRAVDNELVHPAIPAQPRPGAKLPAVDERPPASRKIQGWRLALVVVGGAVVGLVVLGVLAAVVEENAADEARATDVEKNAAGEVRTEDVKKNAVDEFLATMEGFKNDMCACTDEACVEKVRTSLTEWYRSEEEKAKGLNSTQEQDEKSKRILKELELCWSRYENAADGTKGL